MICSWSSVGRVLSESQVGALIDMVAVSVDKMWPCFLQADENGAGKEKE